MSLRVEPSQPARLVARPDAPASTPDGNPADRNIPLSGDYDGDGRTDVGIFDATTSTFYVAKSGGGSIVLTLGDPKHVQVPFPTTLQLQDV